jgi:hypothetical protein
MENETGKIYYIFPVEIIDDHPHMKDCFINNHCMWLFEALNSMEAFIWGFMGVEHMFVIRMDKKFRKEKNV